MKILSGRRLDTFGEATVMAFGEVGKDDISPDVATLFAYIIDVDKLRAEAEKDINIAIHNRYGRDATWFGSQWFIAQPQPRYDRLPVPRMTFIVQGYLVAAIVVRGAGNSRSVTLVGPIGKPKEVVLPLSFLQAILDDELDRFEIVGKDGRHTSWSVPGLRETLRLPNTFVTELSAVLRTKCVAEWLLDFGSEGKAIAPMVVGSLLGLQFHDVITPLPIGQQPYRREAVIAQLTQMFGSARAAEMFEQGAPHLKASMTNDEALILIVKEDGRRY